MAPKKKYQELDDIEKLHKQWRKLSGLHTREEWSAAIVRAATAAEIAANFAIRHEFKTQSQLDGAFVDSMLRWANGLAGKLDRLLVPLTIHEASKKNTVKKLNTLAKTISDKRNAIVHQGEFCNEEEAKVIISQTKEFITTLVRLYDQAFQLKERKKS